MGHDALTETLRLIAETAHRPAPARRGTPRVVIVGPPWTAVSALARATLRAWLDVPAPAATANLTAAVAHLPADLLLVDVNVAAEQATALGRLREEWPQLPVVGLADRPDEEAAACLRTAELTDVLLATDGETATALRLRCLLERTAGTAAAPERASDAAGHASGVLRDLAARLVPEARLPGRDGLTGLPDRAAWEERLEIEIARAARTGDPLALVLVDVDDFAAYDARHGRAAADALLRLLAAAWRKPLRTGDFIARVGADEFAILLPACGPGDAERIAERLGVEASGLAAFASVIAVWDGRSNAAHTMALAESALARSR